MKVEIEKIIEDLEHTIDYFAKPKTQIQVGRVFQAEKTLKQLLALADVSGSLHYDEELLIDLWYKRNPCHELNSNSGKDMFWKTAFIVFEDYVREVSRNDR